MKVQRFHHASPTAAATPRKPSSDIGAISAWTSCSRSPRTLKIDGDERTLLDAKVRLEAGGIEVVGVTDPTIFKSIYFRDPNGHRVELVVDTATPEMMRRLDEVKWQMLDEWSRTRRAPKHAA